MAEPSELDDRFAKALDVHEQLMGRRFQRQVGPGQPEVVLDLWGLIFEHCFADLWSRPGLETRTRCFITMSMLIALGQPEELRAHVKGAMHQGITKDELVELVIHSIGYCGVPRASAAFRVMADVFAEDEVGS